MHKLRFYNNGKQNFQKSSHYSELLTQFVCTGHKILIKMYRLEKLFLCCWPGKSDGTFSTEEHRNV